MIKSLQQERDGKSRLQVEFVAASVILVALVIRLIGLGAESGWIDEAYSIGLARYPVMQIIQGTASDQHPPLYYLLLHIWMLFGSGVTYARLLSALLGTLNVFQVMAFGWKVSGKWLGIVGALLLAISPFHVWYSQEVRQYMLLACLTTAATIELWNCLHGARHWWQYYIFVILAIYTQYFAIFIFLAHAVLVVSWAYRERNRKLVINWIITMIGTGLAFAPWLPIAVNQFLYHTMPWIGEPAAGDLRDIALRLLLGNGVVILPGLLRWGILLFLVGLAGWILYKYRPRDQEFRWGLGFIALWALIPFLAISIIAIFYPVFQFKQYLIMLAPLLLAVTRIALVIPNPWKFVSLALLVLASGLTLGYQQQVLSKDDWRGVAHYIEIDYENGDLVYGNPAASSLALGLYWEKPLPFKGYPPSYDILHGGWVGQPLTLQMADEVLTTSTQGYKRVWLVEFFPQLWDSNEYLSTWLKIHGVLLDDKKFGAIHLRIYKLSP
jgi:4-amino-4-deoxy-L-arabinose transferase-like glycosyltransferase